MNDIKCDSGMSLCDREINGIIGDTLSCSSHESNVGSINDDDNVTGVVGRREDDPHIENELSQGYVAGLTQFTPCAATASQVLVAHGSSVLCLRYDKERLSMERFFREHETNIQLLLTEPEANASANTQVFSYDGGRVGIVWDIPTGKPAAQCKFPTSLSVGYWVTKDTIVCGLYF
jgi:hypothetical protein